MESGKDRRFDFLAHYVEPWNWLLPFNDELNKAPEKRWKYLPLAPLYGLMSLSYLFGRQAFNVVDRFTFENHKSSLNGRTTLLRNFGYHFFMKSQREKIRARIVRAVLDAQNDGVDVVGLGALTKAEWLTEGGKVIVDQLGDQLRIPVVHGDTLTAATVIRQAKQLITNYGISTPVFITGATSKIGRAVVLALVKEAIPVIMYTESKARFAAIQREVGDNSRFITMTSSLEDGSQCRLWITGKAIPSGKNLLPNIPKDNVVLNFSVPNPVTEKQIRLRSDVRFFEGGLLAYDPAKTNLRFTMRLNPGTTYACHAGTMVHAYKGWQHHEVGHVDMESLEAVWEAAEELGFYLPPLK
ncbi:MAG: hypothetical protein JW943_08215 [Deltaproteobacteria bacterium]|nr:hypothetical protein [Deltaproteobacteria bacterium]